jgi:cyclophilin family peptidyl-prolyl cis-trans isomerase
MNPALLLRPRLLLAAVVLLAGCGPKPAPKRPAYVPPEDAPTFQVRFVTNKGVFVVEVHRDWAPIGVQRFRELVRTGFFNDSRFFRVVRNYVVQFGLSGRPSVDRLMSGSRIPDDPVKQSNTRGAITFATSGPLGRTCQVFINLSNNRDLDKEGFAPFGQVTEGMDKVVDRIWSAYGDWPPAGKGPDQQQILREGNQYLDQNFPRLDRIVRAVFVEERPAPSPK